ncbi:hypothetical protein BDW02DRAFT_509686, partial [Decorospora gaudefroyi]
RPSNREIRVLDLLPGDGSDEIQCQVRVVDLDKQPDYEALSYVWGDTTIRKSIQVSGNTVMITPNLYHALLRLRYSTRRRTLWIDQLCINQWDVAEKAVQVAMMRDIYRRCSHCIFWFGEIDYDRDRELDPRLQFGETHAEAVFDFIKAIGALPEPKLTDLWKPDLHHSCGCSTGTPLLFCNGHEGQRTRRAFTAFSMDALPTAQACSYTIPASTMFANATLDLIRSERNLRAFVASSELIHITPGLPTWAIDFASRNLLGARQLKWWNHSHRYQTFMAGGDQSLRLDTVKDGEVIALTGVLVDEIRHINQVYEALDNEPLSSHRIWEIISSAKQLVSDYADSATLTEAYPGTSSDTWRSAWWRTLIGDLVMRRMPVERANKPAHEAHFASMYESLQRNGRQTSSNILYESLCGMVPNHAFFITKNGYMGMGPPHVQAGDQVWVLYGGHVPFVMRRALANPSGADSDYHGLDLVGDAYVHGVMDGEAVRDGHQTQTVHIQ